MSPSGDLRSSNTGKANDKDDKYTMNHKQNIQENNNMHIFSKHTLAIIRPECGHNNKASHSVAQHMTVNHNIC